MLGWAGAHPGRRSDHRGETAIDEPVASPPWPDLRSLHLLTLVAEHGSVGKAAAATGVSQAAASRRLDTLERDLGLALLVRDTTGSRLTEQGQVVVDWATTALEAAGDLLSGVDALRQQRRAALRVAASMTVAEYLMPGWLAAFLRTAPDVGVGLRVTNSDNVATLLREGATDVGFIESLTVPPDLGSRRVGSDRLVIVVAPGHPWARRRRPVHAEELAATPLVVREKGSGTRTTLEHLLARSHQLTAPLLELESNSAVKVAVESGMAPAVLSVLAVASELHERRLVEVRLDDVRLDRPLTAVWSRHQPLSGPATALVCIAGAGTARA